jgi:hypothetical protein
MNLAPYIAIGGMFHFGILLASALTPKVLDWRNALDKLDRLSRQLVWVHGAFIVLVIVAFGVLSVSFAAELASGGPLARGVCAFIALFWGARLAVQFFVLDAQPMLTTPLLRIGYHSLTALFGYLTIVFTLAAAS